jgi:hypothetical protein
MGWAIEKFFLKLKMVMPDKKYYILQLISSIYKCNNSPLIQFVLPESFKEEGFLW